MVDVIYLHNNVFITTIEQIPVTSIFLERNSFASWGVTVSTNINILTTKSAKLKVNIVVRASSWGAIDLGLIPSRVKPMTLKLVLTASLLDFQH